MPAMLSSLLFVSVTFLSASQASAPPEPCPMTEAQMSAATGMNVVKRETTRSVWQTTQCVFTMESGTVQLMRLTPESRRLSTEAELAADYEKTDARRRLKDFPVPAYSFTGGVNIFTPKGVWQVIAQRGPGGGLDQQKIGRALVEILK
jgi:hypothetical protein